MKRNFKIFFCCVVFLMFMVISNFNSTMEIETEVQPKFKTCLEEYGGTVKFISGGNNNDMGGKTEIAADSSWRKGPVTATVHAYASSFDKINQLSIRIYNNSGKSDCTQTNLMSLLGIGEGTSYSDIKFEITFSGKDMWRNIQVWQKDSHDTIGSKGYDEIQIDVTPPKLLNFDTTIEGNNLKLYGKVKDVYSKLDSDSIKFTVSNPDTGYTNVIGSSKNEGDDSRSVSATLPLSEVKSGKVTVTLSATDNVGNNFNETRTLTIDADNETMSVATTAPTSPAGQGGSGGSGEEGGTLATGLSSIGKNNYEFTCDDEISGLIDKYWSYVLILGPILMLVMCTIEFVKALMASDADAVKKATSNTVKRTIAFVILMLLKVIMSVLFNFFGIQICW